MADLVIFNAYSAASGKLYSNPIKMGDQFNVLLVGVTLFSGILATSNGVVVETSNDMANWSSTSVGAQPSYTASSGPWYSQGTATTVYGRYARVVVTFGATGGIVNVSAVPGRA